MKVSNVTLEICSIIQTKSDSQSFLVFYTKFYFDSAERIRAWHSKVEAAPSDPAQRAASAAPGKWGGLRGGGGPLRVILIV